MDWFEELTRVMPPPAEEKRGPKPFAAQWAETEAALGVGIPEDYKRFVEAWGSDGAIGDFFHYYSPASDYSALLLPRATARAVWGYDEMRAGFPKQFPLPKFPAEGSFLPIGVTGNGDYFGWIVGAGAPETWRTAWLGDEEGEPNVYDLSFGPWLLALVKGEIKGEALSPPPPEDGPLEFVTYED